MSPLARWLLLACLLGHAALARALETVALWDFDNNTVGPMAAIQAVEPLKRILPEALLARLSQAPGLRLIERARLREILEEQKLGSSALADQETRLRLGRILGAGNMIFGEYLALGPAIRVDVRLVDVETGRILFSEPVIGDAREVIAGMADIADRLARRHGRSPAPNRGEALIDPAVWAIYETGLRQMEEKRYDQAIESFKQALTRSPRFTPAERQIALALERLARGQ